MKIEIKSWMVGKVIFTGEFGSLKLAVEKAASNGANLSGANLHEANLREANLSGADLSGANLYRANLREAKNIPESQLIRFRDDIWAVLSGAPAEVPGLRKALVEGRVDGSQYEGECACLIGTLANVRGCHYTEMGTVAPDSSRLSEAWFVQIKKGDTPEKSKAAKQALDWIDEWLRNIGGACEALSARTAKESAKGGDDDES